MESIFKFFRKEKQDPEEPLYRSLENNVPETPTKEKVAAPHVVSLVDEELLASCSPKKVRSNTASRRNEK